MGRLIMWNVVTLDGLFEGATKWSLDFHTLAWGDELHEFSMTQLRAAEMLVFGRVTYEGMAAHWTTATGEIADFMNALPKVVFSRTLARADWNNTTLVSDDAAAHVPGLKQAAAKDIFVFGSADLSASLMAAGLYDEYRLCTVPVVLGRGTPLFKPSERETLMRLLESRPLKNGSILSRYAPVPASAS